MCARVAPAALAMGGSRAVSARPKLIFAGVRECSVAYKVPRLWL